MNTKHVTTADLRAILIRTNQGQRQKISLHIIEVNWPIYLIKKWNRTEKKLKFSIALYGNEIPVHTYSRRVSISHILSVRRNLRTSLYFVIWMVNRWLKLLFFISNTKNFHFLRLHKKLNSLFCWGNYTENRRT